MWDKESIKNKRFICHRGFNFVAPENTLSAFRLSKEKNFDSVECDIVFTKDGVPVLSHDLSIDRTCASGNKGEIKNLNYADIKDLDFSYDKTAYAGEKIPTFEQFIKLCKELALHAYLDIRAETTIEQVKGLVDIVNANQMQGKVSYMSYNIELLKAVSEKERGARLGYVRGMASEELVSALSNLKTDENQVFMNCWLHYMKKDAHKGTDIDLEHCIARCKRYGIPLEVWTVNSEEDIINLDPYISGVTTDSLNKESVINYLNNKH